MKRFRAAIVGLGLVLMVMIHVDLGLGESNRIKEKQPEMKIKKDIRDYTEMDMERLYDQWEENDEDTDEEDEELDKLSKEKEANKISLSDIDLSSPEEVLKATKKGKTVMLFVGISGQPSMTETETISSVWHTGLQNGHVGVQRYVTDPGRVLFVVTDGQVAWTVKDFLVEQDRCADVTIDGKSYPGKKVQAGRKDEL